MNLYFLPDAANGSSGHCIEIMRSLKRLNPDELNTIKIWYTSNTSGEFISKNDIFLPIHKKWSIQSFYNMFRGRIHTTISKKQLDFLKQYNPASLETIHLEDPMFYEAVRYYYPNHQLSVHFHNVFLRIKTRCQIFNIKVDYQYYLFLTLFSNLEKKIFRDPNAKKIFISAEDANFYYELSKCSDYEIWPVTVNQSLTQNIHNHFIWNRKFIWFGGIKAHKRQSVIYFIDNVFIPLRKLIPNLEFHLWGSGSNSFDNKSMNIFGHGFYKDSDFPDKDNSLYINPDLTGGGVKLKVKSFLENGITFISSPFGFEGYDSSLIDNKICHVVPMNCWFDYILNTFNK